MKYRILAGVTLVVIFTFACFGISRRKSYTDIRNEENYLNQMQVAELPEKFVLEDCERLVQILPNVPFILRVQVLGDVEFLYGDSRQKVRVQEVYAGSNLIVGDEIYLTGRCALSISSEPKSIECDFINIPRAGYEYLVFVEEQVDAPNESDLYALFGDSYIAPLFCYEDFSHTIVPTSGESTYVPYAAVKDNEFFAETEAGFRAWAELKKQMLTLYPKT